MTHVAPVVQPLDMLALGETVQEEKVPPDSVRVTTTPELKSAEHAPLGQVIPAGLDETDPPLPDIFTDIR